MGIDFNIRIEVNPTVGELAKGALSLELSSGLSIL
jgi:hypothetical protein